jgi:hypothetical protein
VETSFPKNHAPDVIRGSCLIKYLEQRSIQFETIVLWEKYRMRKGFLRREQTHRPPEGGRAGQNRQPLSADVSDTFLFARLFPSRGFGGQLQNACCLTFTQQGQKHDAPIGKFERVVVGGRLVLVNLSKDGRPMADSLCLPAQQAGGQAHDLACERELRARPDAHRQSGVVCRGESAGSGPEIAGHKLVGDFRWA